MTRLIDADALSEKLSKTTIFIKDGEMFQRMINDAPTVSAERALMLLLNWAEECGFGYDNFPEEYERCKDEIEDMGYLDGMIYIAEKEARR